MSKKFDVVVIGLGAMGSAALYELAKRKIPVLGIDQFSPPHSQGSSFGETRVFRQAIGEGEEYMQLALRSQKLWHELNTLSSDSILTVTGGLLIYNKEKYPNNQFWNNTISTAKKYNIPHTLLSYEQLQQRFPEFGYEGEEVGYYEEGMGYINPEKYITHQLSSAKELEAEIKMNEKVIAIEQTSDKIKVVTTTNEYITNKVIISVGAWIPQLFPEFAKLFVIKNQNVFWFPLKESFQKLSSLPIFVWFNNEEGKYIFGFPPLPGENTMKVVAQERIVINSADEKPECVTEKEKKWMYETYFKKQLPFLSKDCVKAATCIYTSTPDRKFILDIHPKNKNIILASPCSGHGFKYAPAIGEVLAQLATKGKSAIDISPFTIHRFL